MIADSNDEQRLNVLGPKYVRDCGRLMWVKPVQFSKEPPRVPPKLLRPFGSEMFERRVQLLKACASMLSTVFLKTTVVRFSQLVNAQ